MVNTYFYKVLAHFMLNDRPDSSQQGWNTLEKLTHTYHMHEIYAAAALIYNRMKTDPPTDPEMCTCVNDIKGNGILDELDRTAKRSAMYLLTYNTYSKGLTRTGYYGNGVRNGYYGRRKRGVYNTYETDRFPYQLATTNQEGTLPNYDWEKIRREVSDLEDGYLANPTKETADRLLEARPWTPNTLVGRYHV